MSGDKLMLVFSSKPYDEAFFAPWLPRYDEMGVRVEFISSALNEQSLRLCQGASIICLFVNDRLIGSMAEQLAEWGIRLVVLRCAGTNSVDMNACEEAGIEVRNVPSYGPNSVSEHALALMLALNRKLHLAHDRVRVGDLRLSQHLLGFEMKGKTVGVVGTGRIGAALARVLAAMECRVLCYDLVQNPALKDICEYVQLDELLASSRVISLHVPLNDKTYHMVDAAAIAKMPRGCLLINTSRGGLIDTRALIDALKSKHLGGAGLDVYEAESGQFYSDLSGGGIQDDVLARLTTFPNVLITCHQGYFTQEAMESIAQKTFENVAGHLKGCS